MTIASQAPDRRAFALKAADLDTPTPVERLAYSVEEAAVLLGISRTSCYIACQKGELPSRLIGRRRVVPVAALRAYLAAQDGGDTA